MGLYKNVNNHYNNIYYGSDNHNTNNNNDNCATWVIPINLGFPL